MTEKLDFIEKQLATPHQTTIIWLHGLGDSGHGHLPIADAMRLPESLGVKFIFPHAPEISVTVNGGMVMPAWYDILEMNIGRKIDEEGIERSSKLLSQIIEQEVASGIEPSKIILAGFSQGGAVVLHTGLKYPVKLGGIICMSTYLGASSVFEASTASINQDTPIFWAHGSSDPVVPISLGMDSIETIRAHGYQVEYEEYPMDHSIHPNEIADVQNWIVKILSS